MTAAAAILFWLSIGVLAYVYVGYPLVVYVAGLVLARPVKRDDVEPTVTILITAFNEESAIAEKLANTLAIEYPKEKLRGAVAAHDKAASTELLFPTVSLIDKAVNKGIIHKNTAARYKSRLTKHVNKLS